jgi:putative transposase
MRRRSIRLKGYDYTSAGAYFVTVCAHSRQTVFEDPVLREILERTWHSQEQRFPGVVLDCFCIMPNHIHFIVWLKSVGAPLAGAHDAVRAGASPAPTLSEVVGAFKSIAATEWLKWLRQHAPHRSGRVWQRNYYERVIRNEDELSGIREYIHVNSSKWELDRENPHHVASREYTRQWGWLEGG